MKMPNKSFENIKQAFQFVHQEKQAVEPTDKWRWRVMDDVRKLNALESSENAFLAFERFFWRISVTGQISLILALLYVFQVLCLNTFQTDENYKQSLAQEFLENPHSVVMPIPAGMFTDENQ